MVSRNARLATLALATILGATAKSTAQDNRAFTSRGTAKVATTDEMKDFVARLKNSNISTNASATDFGSLLTLLEGLREALSVPENITAFRAADDRIAVTQLVSIAQAENAGLRFNAASILANVTDNSTLCVILDKVIDRGTDIGARYNLLQTVKVVSTFANRDNSYWIRSAVDQIRNSSESRSDVGKTLQVLSQIDQFLLSQRDQFKSLTMRDQFSGEHFRQCADLPGIASMEATKRDYTLYIHSKRSSAEIDKLKTILSEAGFRVSGPDADIDPAGGSAIEYSTRNKSTAGWNRNIAQFVADTISAKFSDRLTATQTTFTLGMKVRGQTSPDDKSIGVWF